MSEVQAPATLEPLDALPSFRKLDANLSPESPSHQQVSAISSPLSAANSQATQEPRKVTVVQISPTFAGANAVGPHDSIYSLASFEEPEPAVPSPKTSKPKKKPAEQGAVSVELSAGVSVPSSLLSASPAEARDFQVSQQALLVPAECWPLTRCLGLPALPWLLPHASDILLLCNSFFANGCIVLIVISRWDATRGVSTACFWPL
jgi:hypothetical protein